MSKTRASVKKELPEKKPLLHKAAVPATKKVFFLAEHILVNGIAESSLRLEYFHHPGTGQRALFLTCGNEMLEVIQFTEPRRSWLLNNEICCNGRIYMTASVDSAFFALHYLRKYCSKRAIALDSIHDDEDTSATRLLTTFVKASALRSIADVKTAGDMTFYKYNEKKAIAWLAVKTRRVATALRTAGVHCGHSAKSQNYERSEKAVDETVGEMDFMRMACDIVGGYIDQELHDELTKYLKIPSVIQAIVEEKKNNATKRKTTKQLNVTGTKKVKIESDKEADEKLKNSSLIDEESETEMSVSIDDVKPITMPVPTPVKERTLTTKEKALAKSAKGTKSISSFFKK